MKKKIVIKFGGSNLKGKKDISKLIKAVKLYQEDLVIVVSAFFNVTDFLIQTLNDIPCEKGKIKSKINNLKKQTNDFIRDNVNDLKIDRIIKKVSTRLNSLENYLKGLNYLGEIPDFSRDHVLSYGEKISSYVLTEIFRSHDLDAVEVLPEDLGLITDGEYGEATIDIDNSRERVKENFKAAKIFIVPGFYGISQKKQITLLGRGGSDYSAAAIANCIDAKSLDIWKDVDGFQSGDPRVVDKPIILKNLSYVEASELSYFGAKILHPRTVEPLSEKNIPIRIFNINKIPEKLKAISHIHNSNEVHKRVFKSVAASDDISYLKLKGPGVGIKPGILSKVTSDLVENNINIKSVITSQTVITLLLSLNDLPKASNIVKDLDLHTVCNITQGKDLSLIACVGEGVKNTPGMLSRMLSAVSNKGINIKAVSFGSSEVAVYILIDKKDKKIAIEEIHKEFFQ